jgi:hypothetical protein
MTMYRSKKTKNTKLIYNLYIPTTMSITTNDLIELTEDIKQLFVHDAEYVGFEE